MPNQSKKIAITCGDPSGVGPEIIEKWLKKNPELASELCLIAPEAFFNNIDDSVERVSLEHSCEILPGKPTVEGAKLAFDALNIAAEGCKKGDYASVVTAPVSKEWMVKAGFDFPGQTEFFADRWGGDATMAFAGGKMTVVLATWHIPLMDVASAISKALLERAVKNASLLAQALGASNPSIGVCGLNPHAGEGGILGKEEVDVIDPILSDIRSDYPKLSASLPGDTVFHRHLNGEFDVVIALYHDQGLAPLKTVDFDQAVNITLGLPWVRTSPDHGTGFDIAGKGIANISSFENAFNLAKKLGK